MTRLAPLLVAGLVLTGCGITRIDAPISFQADRRLSIESPEPEEKVGLPLTVRWSADDVDTSDGTHFALFVDRPPPPPDREIRLQVCTEREKLPPQLGELRGPCEDDRTEIRFADEPSYRFDCFEPRFSAPKRRRHVHTVTVVLVDADGRRLGQAADTVKFEVEQRDVERCRGLA